jgi:serine/threonine-protein kinase
MAPEQMAGKKVTSASDIFSLGVTFYQLLSGGLPFRAENLAALSYQIIHGKAVPIRDLRPGLPASATRIINKALQKDPRKRYASAGEMARALRSASAKDF